MRDITSGSRYIRDIEAVVRHHHQPERLLTLFLGSTYIPAGLVPQLNTRYHISQFKRS